MRVTLLGRALGAVVVAAALAVSTACSTGPTFTNPIRATGQDPFVSTYQQHYLLVESRDDGIWIVQSAKNDLTGIGKQHTDRHVWTPPESGPNCSDLWAPELHHLDGRWYIYYAATTCDADNKNHRMFVLESTGDSPFGPYQDRGRVVGTADHWSIDGTVISWAGRHYFVWSGWPGSQDGQQNLYIAAMTSPTALAGPRVLLSSPSNVWEQRGAAIQEGPEGLTHDGKLFLIYSASGSWTDDYAYGMLTFHGTDPLDPASWTKSARPVFSRTADVWGPGHGSFVKSPDGKQDWMIYHSAIAKGSGWFRQIDAQPFTWKSDGTPDFGKPASSEAKLPVPSGQD